MARSQLSRKSKTEMMGQQAMSSTRLLKGYQDSSTSRDSLVAWIAHKLPDYTIGWITGFRTLYNGTYFPTYRDQPGRLILRTGVPAVLLALRYDRKPVYVPETSLRLEGGWCLNCLMPIGLGKHLNDTTWASIEHFTDRCKRAKQQPS